MKKIKLHGKYIKTAFITATLVTSFFTQANFDEEKIAIDNPKTCFSGPFSTYEYWIDHNNKKSAFFDEQRFAKGYPKERFDNIKNNMVTASSSVAPTPATSATTTPASSRVSSMERPLIDMIKKEKKPVVKKEKVDIF